MTLRWSQADVDKYLRRGQDPPLTERAWQTIIMRLLANTGHYIYHTHDSRRSPSGFPDIVAVRPAQAAQPKGRLLFAELKTETGQVTLAQQAWIDALQGIEGIECYVWRPADMEEIVKLLRYNL